jgi:hypothetical protein
MKKFEGKVARRSYIANPHLVERLATGAPLAEVGWKTVYGSGPNGYSGYPSSGWRVNSTRRTRPINSVRSVRKPRVFD